MSKKFIATNLLLALPFSLLSLQIHAAMTQNSPDKIIVTASPSQDPQGPISGLVATKTLSTNKILSDIDKTPQSISVITRDQMDAQDVSSVSQALRYTPGVFTEYRGSSNRNDEIFIRGYSYAPRFLDGLSYGMGASSSTGAIDPWLLERVELIRGPSSVLYGQLNPGGLVAMTSKRPTSTTINHIQARVGNDKLAETAFDFAGSLSDDNRILYRLNGLAKTQHTQIKDYKEERFALAPAITFLPNEQTRLTLLSFIQQEPEAGYRNFLPAYGTVKKTPEGTIPFDFNVNNADYHQSWRQQYGVGYEFEHEFNDRLKLIQNARYSHIKQKYKYLVFGSLRKDNPYILERRAQQEKRETDTFGIDTRLQADFDTEKLAHTVIIGIYYQWSKNKDNLLQAMGPEYDLDWRNPNYHYPIDISLQKPVTNQLQKHDQLGIYLQDQIQWKNWILLGGLRQDWAQVRTYDHIKNSKDQQDDQKLTGRVGLLYAFDNGISPYISYSTSFEPNLQTRRAPGSAPFEPSEGRQLEAGIKYLTPNEQTLATLSIYQLQQRNVTNYNAEKAYFEPVGEIRSRGIEAQINSQLTENISFISSYAYTDTEVRKTITAGTQGKELPRVPKHMASFWGQYDETSGLFNGAKAGFGVRYIGVSQGDTKNTISVPAVTLYDAMVGYSLGELSSSLKGAEVQLNMNNIANKHYVASCASETACFYGIGRTMTATINYRW
ncbi:TonB-dependent siderophore receptor [Proteus mirabilis]|nr:TonB-dependent siderophore receptor [Proteus mirabilis]EKT9692298.1 TonB-dependent siderophore receptor [Proteus mirabilis]EKX9508935.1 TonB-dependent siderophore receptor [Proteus mirabilis]MBG2746707.1 TonB-dependent siderophore receptor [Proteus mirabilis]HEJ9683945.1 TonB-dependent siderophore receptor [Proteus mirabilis]